MNVLLRCNAAQMTVQYNADGGTIQCGWQYNTMRMTVQNIVVSSFCLQANDHSLTSKRPCGYKQTIICLQANAAIPRILRLCVYKKKSERLRTSESCGGRIRTCDLQVMSLASYQLLHSAMFFFLSGCKGTTIFVNTQIFAQVFSNCIYFYSKSLANSNKNNNFAHCYRNVQYMKKA